MSRLSHTEIIHVCQRMDGKGWVANHDGNVSVREEGGLFRATPSGRPKYALTESDLVQVDAAGKVQEGTGKIFSEWALHARIYEKRADARAVVHAHGPASMSVGSAGFELSTAAIPEAVVSLGPGVPLVSLQVPGNPEILACLDRLLPHYDAVLIAGNGCFAWGPTLESAYLRLELVEHVARCLLESIPLGGAKLLDRNAVQKLLKKREEAGLNLPLDPDRPHGFLPE